MAADWRDILLAFVAACLALGGSNLLVGGTDHPWLLASLGGSCVILFGMPGSEMSRPRSFLGGHLAASLVRLACLHFGYRLLGGPIEFWMIAAVAVSLALMMATGTIHSPAGANPIVLFMEQADWNFLVSPLAIGLGTLFLVQAVFGLVRRRAG